MKNRVAIITGSASGMGRDTAFKLAKNGAKVVINDIAEDKVEQTAKELRDAGFTMPSVLLRIFQAKTVC